jgi:hypothetical protein
MGRLEGTYPTYSKIDVDPQEWPDSYWESSRECPKCKKQWPAIGLFHESPCCGATTILAEEVPDMRWPEAVTALLTYRFNKWYDEYNENVDDDKLPWTDITTNGQFDETKAQAEVEALLDDVQEPVRNLRSAT